MADKHPAKPRKGRPPVRPARPGRRGGPERNRPSPKPAPKVRPDRGPCVLAEIVSVGREILRGRIADTNARQVAAFLSERGARVHRITVVDDREHVIAAAITEAFGRGTRLVITLGGLGPGHDDRTVAAVGRALNLPLTINERARAMVEHAYSRMKARGEVHDSALTQVREKLCSLPVGCEPVPNELGPGPGFVVRLAGGAAVLALPGAPEQARVVLEASLESLRDLAPRGAVAVREVESPTADESELEPLLVRLAEEYPAVWIRTELPRPRSPGRPIRIQIEASAPSRNEAESLVEVALRRLIALAGGG